MADALLEADSNQNVFNMNKHMWRPNDKLRPNELVLIKLCYDVRQSVATRQPKQHREKTDETNA